MFVPIYCSLVVATAAASISFDDCPKGLIRDSSLQVFGDSCFQFKLNERRPYVYAEKQCEKHGGTLALVKSKEINDFIVRHITLTLRKLTKVWIGLNDRDDENTFVWEDGTRLGYDYSNWANHEGPREGFVVHNLEDCVTLDPGDRGQWHDHHCTSILLGLVSNNDFAYVCQYKVQAKTTKPPPSTTIGEVMPPTTTLNVERPLTTTFQTTTEAGCSELVCTVDCGMQGYKKGKGGCAICECRED